MANGRAAVDAAGNPLAREPFLAIAEIIGRAAQARIVAACALAPEEVEALAAERIETRDETLFDRRERESTPRAGSAGSARSAWPSRISRWRRRLRARKFLRAASRPWASIVCPGPRRSSKSATAWRFCAAPRERSGRTSPTRRWLRAPKSGSRPLSSDARASRRSRRMIWTPPWPICCLTNSRAGSTPRRRRFSTRPPARASRSTIPRRGRAAAVGARAGALWLSSHPTLARGRVPLTLELLSPAHRPIQTTRDLPGFWAGSWSEVKKEMKGRYPRHLWPDDPATAAPTTRQAEGVGGDHDVE